MAKTTFDIVIVGAGHGGAQAALALRQAGFEGTIAIVGDEPELPYERPPLSKEYFAGEKDFERILIRPASAWADRQIEIICATRIVAIDPVGREIVAADGRIFGYGKLIWAAGGTPRALPIPGADLSAVFGMRSRADSDAIKSAAHDGSKIVIVGGGYIGLEAAAVLTKMGKQVVLLEALDRVLARVAGPDLSRFYEAEHRAHGVDIRLGASAAAIEGQDKAAGVRLVDGEIIPADMVIVGIGIVPSVQPLIAAEAAGDNGVLVDKHCRTSLADIYAIGDCAAHKSSWASGETIRLESVQNANDMATTVAKHICGQDVSYQDVPWFWSNQYDLKLQTVGISSGYDQAILRGDPASRSFSVVYFRAGRVVALDCVNRVKDYVQGRKLVLEGASPKVELLADAALQLKELAASKSA